MIEKTAVASWIRSTIYDHRAALIFGALTIAILFPPASQPQLIGLAFMLGCLIVPSQICLIALWSLLGPEPVVERVGRAVLWTGGLYFIVLAAAAIYPGAVGRAIPVALAIAICGLLAGASLAGGVIRRIGWRLVQSSEELAHLPSARAGVLQFRLSDMLRWMTTLCVFLALGAAIIPRFSQPYALHSYDPAFEIIEGSLCGSVCVAGPLGAISAAIFWLITAIEDFLAAFRLAARDPLTWVVLVWSFLIAVVLSCPGGGGSVIVVSVLVAACGFVGPMAAASLIVRGLGFRLKIMSQAEGTASSPK